MGIPPLRHPRHTLAALALTTFGALIVACGTLAPPVVQAPPPPAKPVPPPEPADALPRIERIATGYPNQPYEVRGERFEPENTDVRMHEIGRASWYGQQFHGRPTATGERYDMHAMTAAHPTMPLPSYARIRNLKNGREVIVRVNDRGPFHAGRVIDLSQAAARKLRISGTEQVEVMRLTHDDIRTGAWRGSTKKPAPRHAMLAPTAVTK